MEYRGTVQGGVIVLEAGVQLPEGQLVDVTPLVTASTSAPLPAAGLWADRTDLGGTAAEASLVLRRLAESR